MRVDTGTEAARSQQWRDVGLGAQILKDLGISSIRLLSSSQRTYVGLGGFGIEIVGHRDAGRLTHDPIRKWPFFRPGRVPSLRHGATPSLQCHRRSADDRGLCAGGFRRADRPFRRQKPERHCGRRRTGDRGRRLLFDGPGRAGTAARRLCGGAHARRNSCRRCARAPTARSPSPISNGPAQFDQKIDHAMAADRRPGIGRRRRRRNRRRALPARLAHLDFRRD